MSRGRLNAYTFSARDSCRVFLLLRAASAAQPLRRADGCCALRGTPHCRPSGRRGPFLCCPCSCLCASRACHPRLHARRLPGDCDPRLIPLPRARARGVDHDPLQGIFKSASRAAAGASPVPCSCAAPRATRQCAAAHAAAAATERCESLPPVLTTSSRMSNTLGAPTCTRAALRQTFSRSTGALWHSLW